MSGSTEDKAISANILPFLSENERRLSISQRQFLPSCCWALAVDTLEDTCQTGSPSALCFPSLLSPAQPATLWLSLPQKTFFSSSTPTRSHQRPYHLVPTAILHKPIPQDTHLEVVSETETHFLASIIGLSSLQICKRNVIWCNTL